MGRVFIIFRSGISGGTGTLSIRIGEYLLNKGYEVAYICQIINDENNLKIMKDIGIKVYQWDLEDVVHKIVTNFKNKECIALTYSLNEFLFIESHKKKMNLANNILYVVHHHALIKGKNLNKFLVKGVKVFYCFIIQKFLNSKNIIFMDKESIEQTEKFYNISIRESKTLIYNLPMNINELDLTIIRSKQKFNTFNLLTIARAEFPFKGYLLGLIDDFENMCELYSDLTLTIITFGEHQQKVMERVSALSQSIKNKVNIVGQTPYNELIKYFNNTHLYIGMGTTVLDAVNHGVPTLLAPHYTYENYTSGFFHDQPDLLVANSDRSKRICSFIQKVKQMSEDEYLELCKEEHSVLAGSYNINLMVEFIEKENQSNCFIDSKEVLIHNFIMKLTRIIRKMRQK